MTNNIFDGDPSLEHSGVKGMKWGRRRTTPRPLSQDAAKAVKLQTRAKKHGPGSLSNAELKRLAERQNLEKTHKNLNPDMIKKGVIAVGATLALLKTAEKVYKYANSPVAKKGKDAIADLVEKKLFSAVIQHF